MNRAEWPSGRIAGVRVAEAELAQHLDLGEHQPARRDVDSSAAANATEWTRMSSPPPNASPTSPNTLVRSSSERTSHSVTSGLPTDSARSRTFFSIRSPWKVKASWAPSSASRFAIAHAIERLFATPSTKPRLPS